MGLVRLGWWHPHSVRSPRQDIPTHTDALLSALNGDDLARGSTVSFRAGVSVWKVDAMNTACPRVPTYVYHCPQSWKPATHGERLTPSSGILYYLAAVWACQIRGWRRGRWSLSFRVTSDESERAVVVRSECTLNECSERDLVPDLRESLCWWDW